LLFNDLRLKFFFGAVENALFRPTPKTAVNGKLLAEFFRQGSPTATVFCHLLKGLQEGQIVYLHIAAMYRQEIEHPIVLLDTPLHNKNDNKSSNKCQE
jgi:hypothetical protein